MTSGRITVSKCHFAVAGTYTVTATPASGTTGAADSAPAGEATATDNAAPTVAKFTFDTPKGIAAFVAWALQVHEGGTMAFQWQTWGNGIDKKVCALVTISYGTDTQLQGFLQSHLIVYTYAYHLTCLATIPGSYTRLDAPPVGALLLCAQAVRFSSCSIRRYSDYIIDSPDVTILEDR